MEVAIHVWERESREELARIFVLMRKTAIVFRSIVLVNFVRLEQLMHFLFNVAQTLHARHVLMLV